VPAIYLGIGSNIDPKKNLAFALGELEKRFGDLEKSSVYRSKAYGFDGDEFLNMVVALHSELTPIEIHAYLEDIERAAGRDRAARGYSPRELDIDLLLHDDLIMDDPPIRLPRADVLRFSFVLGPLAEIAPQLRHPETRQSYRDHWDEFDSGGHPITRERVIS
jgi:2-amino-4-hydroxy-6-hydroxymethyldihydropteridine diphosphokinase